MVLIAGVDEAGKGPVLGPMMVAGVVMQEDRLDELNKLGVKDSKVLSATRRNYLSSKIKELANSYYILEVSARQIDEFRKIMTMNQIMVLSHANVLDQIKPNKAYLDAADVNEERFGENVQKKCSISIEIVAKHKADTKFPIVSAASIIAKAQRDRAIRDMEKEIGIPLGSGYPSDPTTKRFLADWIKEHKSFPEIVRHSWKTTENLLNL
ncbi:MAG: ribonuclease HII [Methanosarcinales archaeon]|nr:ribonuclease HII [Methanosarcinales archaeon]